MSEREENSTFQYTYSAREQEEVKKIREKYIPRKENRMELLRRMDAQVTQKATMYAIVVGIMGALILGIGMCCCLVWAEKVFGLGIVVGLAGMAVTALAYPLYNRIVQKERERIAPEVLRLTEELMK